MAAGGQILRAVADDNLVKILCGQRETGELRAGGKSARPRGFGSKAAFKIRRHADGRIGRGDSH
jgi:hypothetical protein